MIAMVGGDSFGAFCIKDFQRHHVDVSRIVVDKSCTTPFCLCISEDQTHGRNIIYRPGTCRELTMDDLDKNYITSARYLHLSYFNSITKQAAIWAKEKGMKVIFDGDGYEEEAVKNLHLIDVFVASEFFYNSMFTDTNFEVNCRALQKEGPSTVVFTLGEKGCLGLSKEGFFSIPAYTVDAIDTTGAGDVYHGAFIYGLLKAWDTEATAKFASAVAAIKCTRIGGRAGIPDLQTVRRFMLDSYTDYTEIDKRVDFYKKDPFGSP